MSDSIQTPNIYQLMSSVMGEVNYIEKNQRNEHFGYAFRGIDDVLNALHGPLTKYGVFYVPEVLNSEIVAGTKQWHATLKVRFRFYGPNGDHVDAITIAEGIDSADKAATKAMSTALKYALLQVFCIPTEEQHELDPDRSGEAWKGNIKAKAPAKQRPTEEGDAAPRPPSSPPDVEQRPLIIQTRNRIKMKDPKQQRVKHAEIDALTDLEKLHQILRSLNAEEVPTNA